MECVKVYSDEFATYTLEEFNLFSFTYEYRFYRVIFVRFIINIALNTQTEYLEYLINNIE